jgi:BirA family biotin operon repressor/biotin-[acetyl-CoA-carboxylase] ligase
MSSRLPGVTKLVKLAVTGSTQEVARGLAADGAEPGTLVWAERQTAGRGRLERTWTSPKGNLYFSWVLKPRCAPDELAGLGVAAAEGVAAAARRLCGAEVFVKPPNDVYALEDGTPRKLAGILAEASGDARGLDWLVLGVGVNVNVRPRRVETATSLKALAGRALGLERALSYVLEELGRALAGFVV